MPKNPIATQPVKVTLESVTEVQAEFSRLVDTVKNSFDGNSSGANMARERARGMAKVIRTLGLPITIPSGY